MLIVFRRILRSISQQRAEDIQLRGTAVEDMVCFPPELNYLLTKYL